MRSSSWTSGRRNRSRLRPTLESMEARQVLSLTRGLLDAPAHWTLIAILCLGYPEAPSSLPELEKRGWQAREPVWIETR